MPKEGFFYELASESDLDKYTEEYKEAVVVFYKDDCKHCTEIITILQELANDYETSLPSLKFAKMNMFKNPKMSDKLKVIKYPQIALYLDHNYFVYFREMATKEEFDKFFKNTINADTSHKIINNKGILEEYKNQYMALYLASQAQTYNQEMMAKNLRRAFPDIPLYMGTSNDKYDRKASTNYTNAFKFTFHR